MPYRGRVLVLGSVPADFLPGMESAEVVRVANAAEAMRMMPKEAFHVVVAEADLAMDAVGRAGRNELIHAAIDEGIAVLDKDGVITWANHVLHDWCNSDPTGKQLIQALGKPKIATEVSDPFAVAKSGKPTSFQIICDTHQIDHGYIEIRLRPHIGPNGTVQSIVALTRNVTPEVEQQKRLDALHQAGRDLASFEAEELSEMSTARRIEQLKRNLSKTVKDLLHYDIIEVRLLDRDTNELKPLLADGMTAEAAARKLYAFEKNNGVTGFVAFCGRSYLCPNTEGDPHYIQGAIGAKSSLTVPLKYFDEVVGTLNFESTRVDGFGADDLQFTELFSKEVATALHNLDLLSAQQTTAASSTLDAVNREVLLPLDDLLGAAAELQSMLSNESNSFTKLIGEAGSDEHSQTIQDKLISILNSARSMRQGIRKVGEEVCPLRDQQLTIPGAPKIDNNNRPLDGKKVLVIEPNSQIRQQAHQLLARLGAECETATTAAAGIALFKNTTFDAVFLDIRLPDASSYKTYCTLRDHRPNVPVNMATGFGYDAGHAIVKGRADGMQYTLFKPFRPDQVIKAVCTPPLPRGTQAPTNVTGL